MKPNDQIQQRVAYLKLERRVISQSNDALNAFRVKLVDSSMEKTISARSVPGQTASIDKSKLVYRISNGITSTETLQLLPQRCVSRTFTRGTTHNLIFESQIKHNDTCSWRINL